MFLVLQLQQFEHNIPANIIFAHTCMDSTAWSLVQEQGLLVGLLRLGRLKYSGVAIENLEVILFRAFRVSRFHHFGDDQRSHFYRTIGDVPPTWISLKCSLCFSSM